MIPGFGNPRAGLMGQTGGMMMGDSAPQPMGGGDIEARFIRLWTQRFNALPPEKKADIAPLASAAVIRAFQDVGFQGIAKFLQSYAGKRGEPTLNLLEPDEDDAGE